MASRRRLNYRWRLFIPVVLMMWVVLAGLVVFHYRREVEYRTDNLKSQIAMINQRILHGYENDVDIGPFLDFVEQYVIANSDIDEIRVSIYTNDGEIIDTIGSPILRNPRYAIQSGDIEELLSHGRSNIIDSITDRDFTDAMFEYKGRKSNDGKIYVITAMPSNKTISKAATAESGFWLTIAAIAVAVTVLAYLSTKLLSRSVTLLKNFSENADLSGSTDMPDFPHDELGDISRRIVQLYREKDDAISRSERQHMIALNAVQEKARVKRQLTNNINHELKTPVGVIRGYLDTVLDNPDMDPETRLRFLQRAQQNVERLCNLLEDVSAMTRLEEGGSNIPLEDVDFHDLLFNLENDINISGLAGNLEFSYDLPLNCHVLGNTNLLNAMLGNLVKNAAIHSRGTHVGIRLVVESPKFYTFAFWDDGIGVKEEDLSRLFERFFRIDSGRSRKAGGTGLGLPIVKNTVEALGGTIGVHNRSEGGLEFLFTLPKYDGTNTIRSVKREALA